MALSKMFTEFALKLHTKTAQSGAAVYVDGVQDQALNSGLVTLLAGGDGESYHTFGALKSGGPTARISTNDLKAMLDAAGMTGMLIDADGSHPGVVMYFSKRQQGGTRAAGGSHVSATVPNGILVPRTIELAHQGDATVNAEVVARKESTTAPVTFSEADTLPTIYPEVASLWTLGPWTAGGLIEGIERVTIDTGIDLIVEAGDSDIYPTFVAIRLIAPSIVIAARHVDVTSFITEDGLYVASGVVGYARKRAAGGTFVADGTAEHIKFTLGKCRVEWQSIGGDPKSMEVKLTPWYTAGVSPVAPLAINTASAIT